MKIENHTSEEFTAPQRVAANLACIVAMLRDERTGCSREHLDKFLTSINAARQDVNYVLHPEWLQEQGGATMLLA